MPYGKIFNAGRAMELIKVLREDDLIHELPNIIFPFQIIMIKEDKHFDIINK